MTNVLRTHFSQIPQVQEVEDIIAREAKRSVGSGKDLDHFADFSTVTEWLMCLDLPADIFLGNSSWEEVLTHTSELQEKVVDRTLARLHTDAGELKVILKRVTDYLGEADVPNYADVIFIFGSKSLSRIETGIALYKQGLAPKILISGGMPHYEKREQSEAQIFASWATEHGVPMSALVVHDTAISVADNVRGGLNLLDNQAISHGSLILVTAWFAMRRSWVTMQKYVDEGVVLYRVAAPVTVGGDFEQDRWFSSEMGIKTIFNEYSKMKVSQQMGTS